MKKYLSALTLGLATAVAGTSAFADNGTISFEGRITSGTCAIEVVNPIDGTIGPVVKMGSVDAAVFTAADVEKNGKAFALRIGDPAKCGLKASDDNVAKVTFNGTPDGNFFAIAPAAGAATGVAIVIKDRTGASLKPGDASADYPVHRTNPTDLTFNAFYRSTAAVVTAGPASADIRFLVSIN